MKIVRFLSLWLGTLLFANKTFANRILEPLPNIVIDRLCNISRALPPPDVVRVFFNRKYSTLNVSKLLRCLHSTHSGYLVEVKDFTYEIESQEQQQSTTINNLKSVNIIVLGNNSMESIADGMRIVHTKMEKKYLSKFMVVVESVVISGEYWLKNVFEAFWRRQILDIIVFYYEREIANIYTFNPFSAQGFQIYNVSAVADSEMFPSKAQNIHGYKLVVAIRYNRDDQIVLDYLSEQKARILGEK